MRITADTLLEVDDDDKETNESKHGEGSRNEKLLVGTTMR